MRGWAAALRRSSWPRAWSHWIRVGWMPWTVRQCSRIWRWPTSWQGRDGRPSISSNGSCRCPRVSLPNRSEEHTSELQSQSNLVCRLLLEKKNPTLPPIGFAQLHRDSEPLPILAYHTSRKPTRYIKHLPRKRPPGGHHYMSYFTSPPFRLS